MSTFDELVTRYRNMSYGRLSGNNPSAVASLLDEFNDRKYAQILDPSQVTYLGEVPQNQWLYDIHPDSPTNPIFGMPGESVQGGLIGDGTTGWATYDPSIDYGDPGYAGVIPGEGGVGTGLISEAQRPEGSGRGPVHMREDLHAASKAMGWENLGTYQNPSYKDQGGDTFTFSKDLPYGQVYDQYGRKRTVDFEGIIGNLQGFFADPWGAMKQGYTGIKADSLLSDPRASDYPVADRDKFMQDMAKLAEASGVHSFDSRYAGKTGDPKTGAPFGGGQQYGNWGFDENTNSFRQQTMINGKLSFVGPSYESDPSVPDADKAEVKGVHTFDPSAGKFLGPATNVGPWGGTQPDPSFKGSHANVEGPGPVSKTGGGTGKGPGKNGGFAGKGTGAQGPAGGAMGGGYGNWGGR